MKKDVRDPLDIPSIEEIYDEFFRFDFHEPGDSTTGFSLRSESGDFDRFRIVVITSKPFSILPKMKLINLLLMDEVVYLKFENCEKSESYQFRPLIDEDKKDYI